MIGFLSADLMSSPIYGVLFLYYGASSGVKPTSTQATHGSEDISGGVSTRLRTVRRLTLARNDTIFLFQGSVVSETRNFLLTFFGFGVSYCPLNDLRPPLTLCLGTLGGTRHRTEEPSSNQTSYSPSTH